MYHRYQLDYMHLLIFTNSLAENTLTPTLLNCFGMNFRVYLAYWNQLLGDMESISGCNWSRV